MRVAGWIFTLLLGFAAGMVALLAALYPEARFGVLGLGPYPLWGWLLFALLLGALLVFVWLPALYLRAAAEKRRLRRELAEVQKELAELRKAHPEEVPRIPDRELEG